MPLEIVTAMVAELDGRYGTEMTDRVSNVVLRNGAVDVDAKVTDTGHQLIWAEFHSVGESASAAVDLAAFLTAVAGEDPGGGRVPGLRLALCTGACEASGGDPGSEALPPVWATTLIAQAEPGQILITEAIAIVTGGGLPPGVDLVDRGSRRLDHGRQPERIYELRIHADDRGERPGDDSRSSGEVAPSNLEWARRTVGGFDGADHELDQALDVLTAAWSKALAGERCSVMLSSYRRACKTTVAAELALLLHAERALVLYGRWDRDVAAPDQGVREAFGVYADGCSAEQLRTDLEGWGPEIARLLPDVSARIGGPRASGAGPLPTPGDERTRLFDAVEAWVTVLARRRPTLLILDDVQWADPASLRLIDHLHHTSAAIPLMLVVAVGSPEGEGDEAPPEDEPHPSADVLTHTDDGEVVRIDLDR